MIIYHDSYETHKQVNGIWKKQVNGMVRGYDIEA